MNRDKDPYLINSVLRAAQILESFSLKKPAYTHAELSRKLTLNKSAVTRLLYTLENAGFLEKDQQSRQYRLTHRIHRLGNIYIKQTSLHKEAMPLISRLAAVVNETAHVAVLDRFEVFFLDWVEASQTIGLMSLAGVNLPAYCTSSGKAMLAFQDDTFLDAYLQSIQLKPYTDRTITDPDQLMGHLRLVREQGYAIDNIEYQKEVIGVASPVKDQTGKTIGSISVAGPAYRMDKKRTLKKIISSVKETAGMISKRLGYDGSAGQ